MILKLQGLILIAIGIIFMFCENKMFPTFHWLPETPIELCCDCGVLLVSSMGALMVNVKQGK